MTEFMKARIYVIERGISDGTRPGDPVTREELWTMLHRTYTRRLTLRRIAKHASYAAAVLCFFGAAAACGESNHADGVIIAVMVAFLVGMAVFGLLGELL